MRLNLVFVLVVLLIIYFVLPILILFFNNDKKYMFIRRMYLSLFFIVLLFGVFGKVDFSEKVVYIGIEFTDGFFSKTIITKFPKFKVDIFINLTMLIPIGEIIFIDKIKKCKKYSPFNAISLGLLIGFLIEFFQYLLPINRLVQLSDVVYNSISCLIGYYLISLIYYFAKFFYKLFVKCFSTKCDK